MSNITQATNVSFIDYRAVATDIFQEPLPEFRSINVTIEKFPGKGNLTVDPDAFLKTFLEDGPGFGMRRQDARFRRRGVGGAPLSRKASKRGTRKRVVKNENTRRARKVSAKKVSNDLDSPKSGNQTMGHLRVLWTALSLALGVEVKGEVIRGLPCITRFNQLFCRSGGTSYPSDKIEHFIDENKALIRRMHGEFINLSLLSDSIRAGRKKRSIYEEPLPVNEYFNLGNHSSSARYSEPGELTVEGTFSLKNSSMEASEDNPYVNIIRTKRQARSGPGPLPKSERERVDACLSEEEVATPYWASNSRGKILAVVNTNEFSQIIHQEICTKKTTKRCNNDCGCEQKYKYHRLMAYDPDNDCKGIFMDWFLFPSCCSCRCDPL